ncbi:MAG: hypothetical protein ACOC45_08445 [Alkalispirochaetaceae bacterium]
MAPRRASPVVTKRIRRGRAYFDITWSPLFPVQRWEINASVPSVAGIYEIYYLENARVPRILKVGRAWYGGLRNEIRAESDHTLPQNAEMRDILASGECYYRYTICEQSDDLTDVFSVLVTHRKVRQPGTEATGRYQEVRIREPDKMEIRRARRPHQENRQSTHMGTRVPNMFDVMREMEKQEEIERQRAALEPPASREAVEPESPPPEGPPRREREGE